MRSLAFVCVPACLSVIATAVAILNRIMMKLCSFEQSFGVCKLRSSLLGVKIR